MKVNITGLEGWNPTILSVRVHRRSNILSGTGVPDLPDSWDLYFFDKYINPDYSSIIKGLEMMQ